MWAYAKSLLYLKVANSTNSTLMAWICHSRLKCGRNQMVFLLGGGWTGSGHALQLGFWTQNQSSLFTGRCVESAYACASVCVWICLLSCWHARWSWAMLQQFSFLVPETWIHRWIENCSSKTATQQQATFPGRRTTQTWPKKHRDFLHTHIIWKITFVF